MFSSLSPGSTSVRAANASSNASTSSAPFAPEVTPTFPSISTSASSESQFDAVDGGSDDISPKTASESEYHAASESVSNGPPSVSVGHAPSVSVSHALVSESENQVAMPAVSDIHAISAVSPSHSLAERRMSESGTRRSCMIGMSKLVSLSLAGLEKGLVGGGGEEGGSGLEAA
ncbi:hypothetical protein BDN67DRAFT_760450 [Paxillus ammoniavirescens]|nr:hypothetical protein BDN67DRAFT_760450 [Paxillus ammoniavirescens]